MVITGLFFHAIYRATSFSSLEKFFPGHGGPGYCNGAYSQDDNGKSVAVFAEIKELKKEIIVKESKLNGLMGQDNPDERKVVRPAGDIYDLQGRNGGKGR